MEVPRFRGSQTEHDFPVHDARLGHHLHMHHRLSTNWGVESRGIIGNGHETVALLTGLKRVGNEVAERIPPKNLSSYRTSGNPHLHRGHLRTRRKIVGRKPKFCTCSNAMSMHLVFFVVLKSLKINSTLSLRGAPFLKRCHVTFMPHFLFLQTV